MRNTALLKAEKDGQQRHARVRLVFGKKKGGEKKKRKNMVEKSF